MHAGKKSLIDLEQIQEPVRPDAIRHVEQQRAAGVTDFRGILAGHAIADVILGQQDVLRLLVNLGLMLAHPKNLRGR